MPIDDPNATGPTLHRIVSASITEHGWLLDDAERDTVQAYLDLPEDAGHLYARLLHRVRDHLRDDALSDADQTRLPLLEARGLIDTAVPGAERLALLRVPELAARCKAHGLPHRGRRAALLERLEPQADAVEIDAHRVLHRPLFHRMQALFLRHPRADYRVVVLDAIGVMPKPSYSTTPSASPFSSRDAMLAFEQARAVLDLCRDGESALPFLEHAMAWLAASPPPTPGQRRFSTRRVSAAIVAVAARELERAKQPAAAVQLYQALLDEGTLEPGELAQRAVLATEAAHGPEPALALARRWLPAVDPAAAVAIGRTARRLARKLKVQHDHPPLEAPPVRELALPAAAGARRSHRPLYRVSVDDQAVDLPVEAAVVAALPGRRVLHGESAPWTTLFALLLHELYFLPIPGMLPVPWLSGPLDIGRPAFAEQRREPLEQRLAAIRAGLPAGEVRDLHASLHGQAIAGAHWHIADADALEAIVEALGGPALATILGRLAHEGWQAARGLPDLVVLPGEPIAGPGSGAGTIPPHLLLAEVKGPGDQVRDAQAAWFHLLIEAKVPVELWRVERLPSTGDDG